MFRYLPGTAKVHFWLQQKPVSLIGTKAVPKMPFCDNNKSEFTMFDQYWCH
jgi:hypothetical protein